MTTPASEMYEAPLGSPWELASYRRLCCSTVIIALGKQCERLALGWLVLIETDSVFLTAAAFAMQKAPGSLVAPVAGDISDRVPRSRMLAITALYKAVILALLATLAWNGTDPIWPVFVLIALSGIGQSFEVPATQGLITDMVPPRLAMKAVAMQSTGARAVGALGSLGGGLAIAAFGVPLTLYAGAGVFLIGAAVVATMPVFATARGDSGGINTGIFLQAAKGLLALIGLPLVRMLLLTACSVEMFAFAYTAVMPSMARDVLNVGAGGLGTLTLMAGLGAVIGAATLTILGYSSHKGMLLIGVTITFGLMLIAFASSWLFVLSLFLVMGVGAMAAVFDALQWTLLQQYVPDDMRGRAIGGWVFVVGFGWIGQLALGGVAQVIGVQWALASAGALVMLTGLAAYGLSPRLRVA